MNEDLFLNKNPKRFPRTFKFEKYSSTPPCLTLPIQQSRSRDKLPGFQSLLLHLLAVCPYINSLNSLSLLSSINFITITYLIRFLWGYPIIFRYYSMLKRLLTLLSVGWTGSSSVAGNFICVFPFSPLSSSPQADPYGLSVSCPIL